MECGIYMYLPTNYGVALGDIEKIAVHWCYENDSPTDSAPGFSDFAPAPRSSRALPRRAEPSRRTSRRSWIESLGCLKIEIVPCLHDEFDWRVYIYIYNIIYITIYNYIYNYIYIYALGGVGWPRGSRSWVKLTDSNNLLWETDDFVCFFA